MPPDKTPKRLSDSLTKITRANCSVHKKRNMPKILDWNVTDIKYEKTEVHLLLLQYSLHNGTCSGRYHTVNKYEALR
jgi:hypothetical protein